MRAMLEDEQHPAWSYVTLASFLFIVAGIVFDIVA